MHELKAHGENRKNSKIPRTNGSFSYALSLSGHLVGHCLHLVSQQLSSSAGTNGIPSLERTSNAPSLIRWHHPIFLGFLLILNKKICSAKVIRLSLKSNAHNRLDFCCGGYPGSPIPGSFLLNCCC